MLDNYGSIPSRFKLSGPRVGVVWICDPSARTTSKATILSSARSGDVANTRQSLPPPFALPRNSPLSNTTSLNPLKSSIKLPFLSPSE
jgi:hypothetical protein